MKHKENNFKKAFDIILLFGTTLQKSRTIPKLDVFGIHSDSKYFVTGSQLQKLLESQFECNLQTHSLPVLMFA